MDINIRQFYNTNADYRRIKKFHKKADKVQTKRLKELKKKGILTDCQMRYYLSHERILSYRKFLQTESIKERYLSDIVKDIF